MADWLTRTATALDVEPLAPEEVRMLLDLTRQVAHTTERRNAPLAAFLLGLAVAGGDLPRGTALGAACARVEALLDASD